MDRRQTIAVRAATVLVRCRAAAARALLALPFVLVACGGGDDASTGGHGVAPPTLAAIVVSPGSSDLGVGRTLTLTAEARDQYGAVLPGVAFSWASSDSGVAVAIDGVATGVAKGTASVTASSGGVTSNAVSLNVVILATGSVAIDKPVVFLTGAGKSSALTAHVFDANGAPTADAVTWTSSAPDKVAVDAAGRVEAKAIGSALIVAAGGGARSAPTLVVVAEPQPGAVLVDDAQVVAVGAPSAGAVDVTLQGVAAPALGTVVLGSETAPVAGKVIATRPGPAGALVVTLAPAPLYELFAAYDIRLAIDLSAFPVQAVAASGALAQGLPVWTAEQARRSRTLAARRLDDDPLAPFKAFNCKADLKAKLLGAPVQLSLENKLVLTLDDYPGYSKHALEGSAAIVGKAALQLEAEFAGGVRCDAQGQVKLPVLGWVSVVVMPAVRFGLGAEVTGTVTLVQGELGVEGRVSVDPVLGWECGGATPECRGLNAFPIKDEFKPKSKFPDEHGMQVKVDAHFYVLAGLDASIFLGTFNASIVEARFGPKQSFDLAFEEDQAARRDYASGYDLKLVGVVEPGESLAAAIKEVIKDDAVSVKLGAEFSQRLAESPKGTHTASTSRVAPGETVEFTVDLDNNTVAYWVLGYNVERVDLYRKGEDESDFTFWKSMTLIASNRATYRWTPEGSEAGKYEFAAFVSTQLPVPLLEVAPNAIVPVEVTCFPKPGAAGRAQALAATCSTDYFGTADGEITGVQKFNASVTWKLDPVKMADPARKPYELFYKPTGSVRVDMTVYTNLGCIVEPKDFSRFDDTSMLYISYGTTPPSYAFGLAVHADVRIDCPGTPTMTIPLAAVLSIDGAGTLNETGGIVGNNVTPGGRYSYAFAPGSPPR